MKIEKIWTVQFDALHEGQCFEWSGMVFMKAYIYMDAAGNIKDGRWAVKLSDGEIFDQWTGTEECTLYEKARVTLI